MGTSPLAPGALAGVKVLDLSRWIAGPFCTMLMADAGAEVIKVEGLTGEDARHSIPKLNGTSAYVHHYNRNKRGLALDLRSSEGQAIVYALATEWADVVVENFRPGILEKIGLGYDDLSRKNPGLVMTSVSGFGSSGPDSQRPGFNATAEAFSGAMSLTGDADSPPTMSGFFAADHSTGLYAAFGTMLALAERTRTGRGQLVEIALTDAIFSLLGFTLTARLNDLEIPPRTGNRDNATAPADLFLSSEGQPVYIDAGTDALFRQLCQAMKVPEMADDPLFATNEGRLQNWESLQKSISDWTRRTPWVELRTVLDEAAIPFSPVNTVDGAIGEPQFAHQGMIASVQATDGAHIRVPGMVLKLSGTPGSIRTAAPEIGQHSAEILRDICGMTAEQVIALERNRIVLTASGPSPAATRDEGSRAETHS
jgi:crotonobetainyl-CoA:carnitine CoA-transferase CaiB-like acyl-CoA transferase